MSVYVIFLRTKRILSAPQKYPRIMNMEIRHREDTFAIIILHSFQGGLINRHAQNIEPTG